MDSMPNNALTSLIGDESKKLFNITFRAGILNETVSEWVAKKEYTSFNLCENTGWRIMVEAEIGRYEPMKNELVKKRVGS